VRNKSQGWKIGILLSQLERKYRRVWEGWKIGILISQLEREISESVGASPQVYYQDIDADKTDNRSASGSHVPDPRVLRNYFRCGDIYRRIQLVLADHRGSERLSGTAAFGRVFAFHDQAVGTDPEFRFAISLDILTVVFRGHPSLRLQVDLDRFAGQSLRSEISVFDFGDGKLLRRFRLFRFL
jgi:hypothetical protein